MTAYHDGEVFLYGSLFTGSLTPSTEEQLVDSIDQYMQFVRGGPTWATLVLHEQTRIAATRLVWMAVILKYSSETCRPISNGI